MTALPYTAEDLEYVRIRRRPHWAGFVEVARIIDTASRPDTTKKASENAK
jgi:hypothetical protein